MVTIYTTENCPRCKMLKTKMDMKGIKYKEEKDIDPLIEMGFLTAPVLKMEDGRYITSLAEANDWINTYEENNNGVD